MSDAPTPYERIGGEVAVRRLVDTFYDAMDRRPEGGRGGSIYDLGYRGYEGPRLGRRAAVAALLIHTLRTAYGLGRNARSKVVPVGLAVLAVLPSLLALGVLMLISTLGAPGEAIEAISPIKYATLFPIIASLVFLFCAAQAPELFGRDQGTGVLQQGLHQ